MSLNLPSEIRSFQATMSRPLVGTSNPLKKEHETPGCDVPMVRENWGIHDGESFDDSWPHPIKTGERLFVGELGLGTWWGWGCIWARVRVNWSSVSAIILGRCTL